MATYAVGDIQGCFAAFLRLLEKIRFNPRGDRLWLVGDIVNRGPNSLDALRWVYENRRRVAVVLGNHDIHLLMVREGFAQAHGADTLDEILAAPDAEKLCDWLRHCPLFHWENGWSMVHAGLLPQWTIADAARLSQEVEKVFASSDYRDFFQVIYGNKPTKWSENLCGESRWRTIINAMTRMRICKADGEMEFSYNGDPQKIPPNYFAWFDSPQRKSRDAPILFGHWSALGLIVRDDLIALDTGCLWGRALTAIRLEDRKIFQVQCDEMRKEESQGKIK